MLQAFSVWSFGSGIGVFLFAISHWPGCTQQGLPFATTQPSCHLRNWLRLMGLIPKKKVETLGILQVLMTIRNTTKLLPYRNLTHFF